MINKFDEAVADKIYDSVILIYILETEVSHVRYCLFTFVVRE